MSVVVVTGTDTGVGKTFVTAALCIACRNAGLRVRAVKPVESGVGSASEPADTEDGVVLARAAGQSEPAAAWQRLARPLAPPVAAELEGVVIADERWAMRIEQLAREADIVFVEAAGGLLSPISDRFDAVTLAKHLRAPLLVVARDALGTINHTRLVLEVARHRKARVLGVVLSAPAEPDASTGLNTPDPATSPVPFATLERHADLESAAQELGEVVDWLR